MKFNVEKNLTIIFWHTYIFSFYMCKSRIQIFLFNVVLHAFVLHAFVLHAFVLHSMLCYMHLCYMHLCYIQCCATCICATCICATFNVVLHAFVLHAFVLHAFVLHSSMLFKDAFTVPRHPGLPRLLNPGDQFPWIAPFNLQSNCHSSSLIEGNPTSPLLVVAVVAQICATCKLHQIP